MSGWLPAALALNNAYAAELSWLDQAGLEHLVRSAFHVGRVLDDDGRLEAFLIGFDRAAAYDSPNFLWFRARLPRFVYVDRVVVAPHGRGRGLAKRLYAGLCDRAWEAGQTRVVCEVNLVPPNPPSDAFHAALGFVEVGRAAIHGGAKQVRYLMLNLPGPGAGAGVQPPPSNPSR